MNDSLVTRDFLRKWGFTQLTDAWLYSSSSKRREYFETWHHCDWNYRVHPGLPGADPLQFTEQEFLLRLADHLAAEGPLSWPDAVGDFHNPPADHEPQPQQSTACEESRKESGRRCWDYP